MKSQQDKLLAEAEGEKAGLQAAPGGKGGGGEGRKNLSIICSLEGQGGYSCPGSKPFLWV